MHPRLWAQHWRKSSATDYALGSQAQHQKRRQRAALSINRSIPCPLQAWTQGAVPSKLQAVYMYAAKEQGWLAYKRPVRATRDAPDLLAFALVAVLADITLLPPLRAARAVLAASTLIAKTPGVLCFSSNSKLSLSLSLPLKFLIFVAPNSHPKASNGLGGMREAITIAPLLFDLLFAKL